MTRVPFIGYQSPHLSNTYNLECWNAAVPFYISSFLTLRMCSKHLASLYVESRHCHAPFTDDWVGGEERLSHISTAMAVRLLFYKYTQMLFFNSKTDFLLKTLCTIFLGNRPANIQQTPFNINQYNTFESSYYCISWCRYCHNCFRKLLQDSNKTVKMRIWCVLRLCRNYLDYQWKQQRLVAARGG